MCCVYFRRICFFYKKLRCKLFSFLKKGCRLKSLSSVFIVTSVYDIFFTFRRFVEGGAGILKTMTICSQGNRAQLSEKIQS